MFRTIVIGADGREGGADALALARALAGRDTRTVEITVDAGVPVAEGLRDAAEHADADLVVVGTCRRGPVGRILAGDVTRLILREASCAVAVAPVGYASADRAMRTLGVGWDGSEPALAALEVARALAREHHAAIRALEVVAPVPWPVPDAALAAPDVARESALAAATVTQLPGVEGLAVDGVADDELARFAEGVDLLIVGSHRRGLVGRIVFGSTSQSLARHCPRPLLVVPTVAAPVAAEA